MLPVTINDGVKERNSWDPAISRALASIMSDAALLGGRLASANAYWEWASAVSSTKAVSIAIQRDAVDAGGAARIAKAAGLSIEYDILKDPQKWPELDHVSIRRRRVAVCGRHELGGGVDRMGYCPVLPRLKYTMGGIRSSPAYLDVLLRPVGEAFHAVQLATWLTTALAASGASAELQSLDRRTLNGYETALYTLGKDRVAQVLDKNERSAARLTVDDGTPSGSTTWPLLGNGDTILLDYDDGAKFAFGAKW